MQTSRFLMLFASFATRGAGFLTSLLIARLAGAAALGVYSTLVYTSAAVATPFAQVLTNNSTVLGAAGGSDESAHHISHARASFMLALMLAALSALAFVLLYKFLLNDEASQSPVFLAVGVCVVIGQIIGGVGLGFLYRAGEFAHAARISAGMAIAVSLLAYPGIYTFGLNGALTLLLVASLLPAALMGAKVLTKKHTAAHPLDAGPIAWKTVSSRFVRAWPSVAAATVNNFVNWLCTIYLVQSAFGAVGVGVVAVAVQWLNLLLIPATSWGGVSLKALSDAIASGKKEVAWHTATGLIRKNLLVTFVLAGSIALGSGLIARAYGLHDTDFALLIRLNAICALVASINNIFERFLLALDRQGWWFAFSLASVLLQASLTYLLIEKGLWVSPIGALAGSLLLCLLGYIGASKALPIKVKEWQ